MANKAIEKKTTNKANSFVVRKTFKTKDKTYYPLDKIEVKNEKVLTFLTRKKII